MTIIQRLPDPVELDHGAPLENVDVAYCRYGELNAKRDNVIWLCHGLTSNQHAGPNGSRKGWWESLIGPSQPLDTDQWCIICSNVLGGDSGSTGPNTPHPTDAKPYATRLPILTIADMVRAQRALLDGLGVSQIAVLIGGCMGGFQGLEWLRQAPERVSRSLLISTTAASSPMTIAMWAMIRRLILTDRDEGMGLGAALGSLFWLGKEGMENRFGRAVIAPDQPVTFKPYFAVEQFLEDIIARKAGGMDPNSLLYLTRAMDLFDMNNAITRLTGPVELVSYQRDWRYPPDQVETLKTQLEAAGAAVKHHVLDSKTTHGAYIFEPDTIAPIIKSALINGTPNKSC
ncbi:alpha/beta fold hydrolase [Spiribacter sp. C176]|uniref:Probable acyltransferase n=1 Tax=Spiribacter salilacus TaxID=2664894 RepID=A0A6N7R1S6_9GAMM|nr:alpha/beta fold hydrolase [Spiribacter salilacus]MRH79014.1 alpha/beta fold hydrolase [Spiribacter salilacus]